MLGKIALLSAGAVKPGLTKVLDAFRHAEDCEVMLSFTTAPEIRKRLTNGEQADVVIAPTDLLDELATIGRVLEDRITLGRIGVGVMTHTETPPPKIATVEEFRQSLCAAASIVYNQASTGIYIDRLINQLGIAAELEAKTTRYPDFAAVLAHIRKGHGQEIGLGATTVIIENASDEVRFVGPLPPAIQNYTTYGAAIIPNNEANDGARALVNFLASSPAKTVFSAAGIE